MILIGESMWVTNHAGIWEEEEEEARWDTGRHQRWEDIGGDETFRWGNTMGLVNKPSGLAHDKPSEQAKWVGTL